MCGRFVLHSRPEALARHFGLKGWEDFHPRWNIPPGTDIPIIRVSPEGKRVLHLLRWGLLPHWAQDPAMGQRLVNARAESVAVKPAFRDAFRHRRCLIPADGFYEWKTQAGRKQPYYIRLRSGEPMALAGLWESWRAPDGTVLRTCTIVTTAANARLSPIHDRMPVIIPPQGWEDWLSGPPGIAATLLVPYPDEPIEAWAVSPRVSRASEDGPELIQPLEAGGQWHPSPD